MSIEANPLATAEQREAETLALRLIETPQVRAAREQGRAWLLADPAAKTPDGRLGLDRALDQWVLAVAMRVVNNDVFRPRIVWNVDNTPRKWFGHTATGAAVAIDNPDNVNREILLDGAYTYELTGQLSENPPQLSLVLELEPEHHGGLGEYVAAMTMQQMQIGADRQFRVTIGPKPAETGADHLQSKPGLLSLFIRDSMRDWRQVPSRLAIRRLDGPDSPPARTEARIADAIAAATSEFVRKWNLFKDTFLGYPDPNRLIGPNGREGGWGYLAGGRYRIADDEAVVAHLNNGGSYYTGFQVTDPWTIAPDPVYRTSSLNITQARANADGASTTYVLSVRDPGVYNWIDTVGLHEGWMLTRWQGVPTGADPKSLIIDVRTVKLADLPGALPPGTAMATGQDRIQQIADRVATHKLRTREG